MEEFNQLVLQQAGVIPLPIKDKADGPSSDNENNSSDTCTAADQGKAKDKEQDIKQSNKEHKEAAAHNNTSSF